MNFDNKEIQTVKKSSFCYFQQTKAKRKGISVEAAALLVVQQPRQFSVNYLASSLYVLKLSKIACQPSFCMAMEFSASASNTSIIFVSLP